MRRKNVYSIEYKGFIIIDLEAETDLPVVQGFLSGMTPRVYLLQSQDVRAYFAFAASTADLPAGYHDAELHRLAVETIKRLIDAAAVENFQAYTFEYRAGVSQRVKDPAWREILRRPDRF